MKIEVNKNFLAASLFVEFLADLGLKHVTLSPGSRNTPLLLAFAENKKVKKHIILDERSSAFFALGIAKATKTPTAVVTTSGTAVGELYPAIIEAYNSRAPLIVLTADRPPYLRETGANQTINQENIFQANIRAYFNTDLPSTSKKDLLRLKKIAQESFNRSFEGPVHVNLPFEKPLEPWVKNGKVEEKILAEIRQKTFFPNIKGTVKGNIPESLVKQVNSAKRVLIFSGGGRFDKRFNSAVKRLALKLNAPIIVDAYSPLKLKASGKGNLLFNVPALLHSKNFLKNFNADLILHFGNAPTTSQLLNAYKESSAKKILINSFGDVKDPSRTFYKVVQFNPTDFCNELLQRVKRKEKEFLSKLKTAEEVSKIFKVKFLEKQSLKFEGTAVYEIVKALPSNSNLFVSNSMPIRDFDYFAPDVNTSVHIFTNRGASGIDGITSTAAGISFATNRKTFLLTGDLAFFHDLNGLQTIKKYGIDLDIIILNNNGGGIFRMLPVEKEKKFFDDYFITPHNLSIQKIASAFEAFYLKVKSVRELQKAIDSGRKGLKIIEIRTDSELSKRKRQKYFSQLAEEYEKRN